MVRKMFLVVVLILVIFWLAGCQTIKGMSGDIEWLGEKTAETVESLDDY